MFYKVFQPGIRCRHVNYINVLFRHRDISEGGKLNRVLRLGEGLACGRKILLESCSRTDVVSLETNSD